MQITIRGYESRDLPLMVAIWNEVVEDGIAFPQEELLTEESGRRVFCRAELVRCGGGRSRKGAGALHPAP